MQKGLRIGLTVLFVMLLAFGGGNLLHWYIQTERNAQANAEAQQLIDLPESDLPLAELPEEFRESELGPIAEPLLPKSPELDKEPVFADALADSLLEIELTELQSVNPDIVGWITIPNTPISYPLLQGEDNEYYLNRNWKKERSAAGSIFMECQNNSDFSSFNTIIYGHRMGDNSMFNALRYYNEAAYLAEHPRIYIVIEEGVLVYEIFASGEVTVTDPVYWLITDQESYKQRMIDFCLDISAVNTGIVPEITDQLLTLSTCASLNQTDDRWVVVAEKIGFVSRPSTVSSDGTGSFNG